MTAAPITAAATAFGRDLQRAVVLAAVEAGEAGGVHGWLGRRGLAMGSRSKACAWWSGRSVPDAPTLARLLDALGMVGADREAWILRWFGVLSSRGAAS